MDGLLAHAEDVASKHHQEVECLKASAQSLHARWASEWQAFRMQANAEICHAKAEHSAERERYVQLGGGRRRPSNLPRKNCGRRS